MEAACNVGAGLRNPIFFHSFRLSFFLFFLFSRCLSTVEWDLDRADAEREPGRVPRRGTEWIPWD